MAETEPNLSEPHKLAGHHLRQDWPKMKKAWKGWLSITLLAFLAGFALAWFLVVAAKNATIETLRTASDEKNKKLGRLDNENAILERQNLDFKTSIAELTAPLKKRTLILAGQLREFGETWKTNDFDFMGAQNAYNDRFEHRVETIVSQLDESGEHSAILTVTAHRNNFSPRDTWTNVLLISSELQRLANNLK